MEHENFIEIIQKALNAGINDCVFHLELIK